MPHCSLLGRQVQIGSIYFHKRQNIGGYADAEVHFSIGIQRLDTVSLLAYFLCRAILNGAECSLLKPSRLKKRK
jgi:hypothetical protein